MSTTETLMSKSFQRIGSLRLSLRPKKDRGLRQPKAQQLQSVIYKTEKNGKIQHVVFSIALRDTYQLTGLEKFESAPDPNPCPMNFLCIRSHKQFFFPASKFYLPRYINSFEIEVNRHLLRHCGFN